MATDATCCAQCVFWVPFLQASDRMADRGSCLLPVYAAPGEQVPPMCSTKTRGADACARCGDRFSDVRPAPVAS